jgi:hypothetical protein
MNRLGWIVSCLALLAGCSSPVDLGSMITCDGGTSACGNDAGRRCVDLASDPLNCGACAHACSSGNACVRGACCAGAVADGRCVGATFETSSIASSTDTFPAREVMSGQIVDFDEDGHADAVFASQLENEVLVQFGDGHGGVSDPLPFAIGRTDGTIAWGDIDGDGVGDLVAAIQTVTPGPNYTDTIRVFRRAGRSLTMLTELHETPNMVWIQLADVDADGLNDILFLRREDGCLGARRGLGSLQFAPATCLLDGASPSRFFVVNDDGDQAIDILTSAMDGTAIVYEMESGRLVERRRWSPVRSSDGTAFVRDIGDGDGDGREDILWVVIHPDQSVQYIVGYRDDTTWTNTLSMEPGTLPRDEFGIPSLFGVGDIDGDALPDFVAASTCGYCQSRMYVLRRR